MSSKVPREELLLPDNATRSNSLKTAFLQTPFQSLSGIVLQTDHHQLKASCLAGFPGLRRSRLEPALQPGTDHLDLKRERFSLNPEPSLEPDHIVVDHKAAEQLFELPTLERTLQLDLTADSLNVRVIVVMVIPVILAIAVVTVAVMGGDIVNG